MSEVPQYTNVDQNSEHRWKYLLQRLGLLALFLLVPPSVTVALIENVRIQEIGMIEQYLPPYIQVDTRFVYTLPPEWVHAPETIPEGQHFNGFTITSLGVYASAMGVCENNGLTRPRVEFQLSDIQGEPIVLDLDINAITIFTDVPCPEYLKTSEKNIIEKEPEPMPTPDIQLPLDRLNDV